MIHLVKAMVFLVVRYGCESWTIKNVECQRTETLKLRCWRTLENFLDCKGIKPINPEEIQP